MNYLSWVDDIINASESDRKRLKEKVLDDIKYYQAKWEKSKSGEHKLVSLNQSAVEWVNELKSGRYDFIGFIPGNIYIKAKGPKAHLDVAWEHEHSAPTLLFYDKRLPRLIITGPNIRFNDSILKEIKENLAHQTVRNDFIGEAG